MSSQNASNNSRSLEEKRGGGGGGGSGGDVKRECAETVGGAFGGIVVGCRCILPSRKLKDL
jgi:hypothetical protein